MRNKSLKFRAARRLHRARLLARRRVKTAGDRRSALALFKGA
jgi:hypothetical protein